MTHYVLVNEDDVVLAVYGSALEDMANTRRDELIKEFARPIRKLTIVGRMKPSVGQRL